MKTTKSFKVKSTKLTISHNTITGGKKFYLNDLLILQSASSFCEFRNHHDLYIEDEIYRFVVIPNWLGGFRYRLEDGMGCNVRLVEVEVHGSSTRRVLGEDGNV